MQPVEPQTFTGSRAKIAPYLAGSLALATSAAIMTSGASKAGNPVIPVVSWAAFILFGLGGLVSCVLLVRPQVLRLDSDGLSIGGGLAPAPRPIAWRDTQTFFIYRLPRGGKMIGFNYSAGYRPRSALRRFNRAFGAEGALPKLWSVSPETMVATLNDYRARALAVERTATVS